jgi:hypothetical protein
MYSTGTTSSPASLLQALATFATSAGWTIDYNNTYSGCSWWLAVHKGTCYLNFVADTPNTSVFLYGATGFNGSSSYGAQPGTSPNASLNYCNLGTGPYTGYHLFSSSGGAAYLHVVVEISAGLFAHFQGGQLNAVGGASPATYIQMTNWSYGGVYQSYPDGNGGTFPWGSSGAFGYIGVTVDGTLRWFSPSNSSPSRCVLMAQTNNSGFTMAIDAYNKSPNTFNGLAALLPIEVFVERAIGNLYAYVGDAPDQRFLNMKNNNPKDEITIGSDTWKIFPMISNNPIINNYPSTTGASSGNYALAFRKNA